MEKDLRVKVQFMLPSYLVKKIEEDAQKQYQKKSAWLEKLVVRYFDEIEKKNEEKGKRILDLNI